MFPMATTGGQSTHSSTNDTSTPDEQVDATYIGFSIIVGDGVEPSNEDTTEWEGNRLQ